MFELLQSLFPNWLKPGDNNKKAGINIKYGVNSDVNLNGQSGDSKVKGERIGGFFGNEATTLGIVNSEIIQDLGNVTGFNHEYIDTEGRFSNELMLEAVLKSIYLDSKSQLKMKSTTYEFNDDNTVGLLYNMLRYYYILINKDLKYNEDDNYYDNGHLYLANKDVFGDAYKSSMITDVNVEPAEIESAGYCNDDDGTPILLWKPQYKKELVHIIATCAGSWVPNSPFAIAHGSGALCQKLRLNGLAQTTGTSPELSFGAYNASDVLTAIVAIVSLNRLEEHFDVAYGMVAQVYAQIKPRSIEAMIWLLDQPKMSIPALVTNRGQLPGLVSMVPMITDPISAKTIDMWVLKPAAMLWHSLALNEAIATEMFVMHTAGTLIHTVDEIYTRYVGAGTPGLQVDLRLIAQRYGKEIHRPYVPRAGLDRYSWLSTVVTSRQVKAKVKDIFANQAYKLVQTAALELHQDVDVVLDSYVPMIFPVLSIGINVNEYYMNAGTLTAELDYDDSRDALVTSSHFEMAKAMTIMRVAGYDAQAVNVPTGRVITNWSDNASGRFLYVPELGERNTLFSIPADGIKKRIKSWMPLPNFNGKITLNMDMSNYRLCMFNDGVKRDIRGTPLSGKQIKPVNIGRQSSKLQGLVYSPVKIDMSGFYAVKLSAGPIARAALMGMSAGVRIPGISGTETEQGEALPVDV